MKAKSGFKLRPLGNEFILVGESVQQINFNKTVAMNQTAAFLWQKVSDGCTFEAIQLAQWLTEEYEVSLEMALADAQKTIDEWIKIGIIE